MMTTTTKPSRWSGLRSPLRWRIVAWFVLLTVLVLAVLGSTTWLLLRGSIAQQANSDVAHEIQEFRQFAARAEEEGAWYAGRTNLLTQHLALQQPNDGEILVGRFDDGRVLVQAGLHTDESVLDDPEFVASVAASETGVATTGAGEVRWGKVALTGAAGIEGATFEVLQFSGLLTERVGALLVPGVGLAGVALLLAAVVAWAFTGWLLRPIRQVQQTSAALTEHDLSQRIPVHGNDELAELTNTLNGMLARLEEAFNTQRQFVDDAGHELRTPITIVQGHLELMGDDPADRRATVELVTRELGRMNRIVSDLLTLARAERPDYINLRPGCDMAALTLEIDAHTDTFEGRNWQLKHIAEGPATIDRERVMQAALQLIRNAHQYTEPGGEISFESRVIEAPDSPQMLRLTVADNGRGVDRRDRKKIFDRFYKADSAGQVSGGGLGLSIVRAIAEGHGGRVWVEDTPGGGATFVFEVPTRTGSEAGGAGGEEQP